MSAVVIEHVKVSELPESWRKRLHTTSEARVTIRTEEEHQPEAPATVGTENPLFGMWRDRDDMVDVEAYLRKLREPRF